MLLAQGPADDCQGTEAAVPTVALCCSSLQTVVVTAKPLPDCSCPLQRCLCWPCVCRDDRRRNNPRPYNTAYRVVVSGLPPTASWQDLKDHMRKGGEVTFAQVGTALLMPREGRCGT